MTKWPVYSEEEQSAVVEVLQTGRVNYWTGGQGKLFEQEFAEFHGRKYGIALSNGTVALELALKSLNVQPGDEVIVTPSTFIASASAIALQGAVPVFADIDADSMNISAESIRTVISERTRGIVAVHLLGYPCDMDAINHIAEEFGLFVLEDCAQAHGARYKGKYIGSFGDVAAFSFCQDKIMSTGGEGGMLLTDDPELWEFAWSYKDHGKNHATVFSEGHPPGFRWVHDSFGTNWRMTEMQAAIGRLQLMKLDSWVQRRRENAAILSTKLNSPLIKRLPVPSEDYYHAYYKYTLQLDGERYAEEYNRERILREVEQAGVPCFSGICPEIYREKAFSVFDIPVQPVAHELGKSTVQLLVDPTFSQQDMLHVANVVNKVLENARAV